MTTIEIKKSILDHFIKAFRVPCAETADFFIGIDLYEFPVGMVLDELGVVVDLGFIRCELLILICRNTGIPSDPSFLGGRSVEIEPRPRLVSELFLCHTDFTSQQGDVAI